MWGFHITFGSITSGPDKLALAFETQELAEEWHAAFEQVVEKVLEKRQHFRSASAISDISGDTDMSMSEAATPMRLSQASFGTLSLGPAIISQYKILILEYII